MRADLRRGGGRPRGHPSHGRPCRFRGHQRRRPCRDRLPAGRPEDSRAVSRGEAWKRISYAEIWLAVRRGGSFAGPCRASWPSGPARALRSARDVEQVIGTLSGGNQQKALLARWLAAKPLVLMVDEPTCGIDVGAKAEIYRLLREYAGSGHGVIVVSSEMPELIALCDRILVMFQGRIVGEVPGETATEQQLIRLATGAMTQ